MPTMYMTPVTLEIMSTNAHDAVVNPTMLMPSCEPMHKSDVSFAHRLARTHTHTHRRSSLVWSDPSGRWERAGVALRWNDMRMWVANARTRPTETHAELSSHRRPHELTAGRAIEPCSYKQAAETTHEPVHCLAVQNPRPSPNLRQLRGEERRSAPHHARPAQCNEEPPAHRRQATHGTPKRGGAC